MKKLLSALFALALCSSLAMATVPYPPNCVVSPCDALLGVVWCPDNPSPIANSIVTLTIRNQANNPIANAAVNVAFGTGPLCVCGTMVYNTTTNSSGVAVLTLRGGGCIKNTDLACVFRANGVVVRDFQNLKSPDWDGAAGNCLVNLSDLVVYARGNDLCFDFNNNGILDITDFSIFASAYTPAHHCP